MNTWSKFKLHYHLNRTGSIADLFKEEILNTGRVGIYLCEHLFLSVFILFYFHIKILQLLTFPVWAYIIHPFFKALCMDHENAERLRKYLREINHNRARK